MSLSHAFRRPPAARPFGCRNYNACTPHDTWQRNQYKRNLGGNGLALEAWLGKSQESAYWLITVTGRLRRSKTHWHQCCSNLFWSVSVSVLSWLSLNQDSQTESDRVKPSQTRQTCSAANTAQNLKRKCRYGRYLKSKVRMWIVLLRVSHWLSASLARWCLQEFCATFAGLSCERLCDVPGKHNTRKTHKEKRRQISSTHQIHLALPELLNLTDMSSGFNILWDSQHLSAIHQQTWAWLRLLVCLSHVYM